MSKTEPVAFHLPMRPFSPIDALNRRAAALGSPRYAQGAAHANYNGHHVTVSWNDYRGYYVADYTWAGRVVLARGSFEDCLRAALDEYARGALGASAEVRPREGDAEAIALCLATPALERGGAWERPPGDMPRLRASWWTWQHDCASAAARDSANPRMSVMIFDWALMQAAADRDAYEAALRAKYGRVYA